MRNLIDYINIYTIENLMDMKLNEGLIDTFLNWGKKFLKWLINTHKSNEKFTSNKSWEDNNMFMANGFDINLYNDKPEEYLKKNFNIKNINIIPFNESEIYKIKNKEINNLKNDLLVLNKEYNDSERQYLIVNNKDDENKLLDTFVAFVCIYPKTVSKTGVVTENLNEADVLDKQEDNKTDDTKNNNIPEILYFELKNIYLDTLPENIIKEICKLIFKNLIEYIKKKVNNEVDINLRKLYLCNVVETKSTKFLINKFSNGKDLGKSPIKKYLIEF